MWELLSELHSDHCSISFSLPFHVVDVSQSELENKSVFVNEISCFGYDGVHKSSESSPLEFSQIEIKYSSSCLAFKSAVSSSHTQPVCDILGGGYHNIKDM